MNATVIMTITAWNRRRRTKASISWGWEGQAMLAEQGPGRHRGFLQA